MAKKRSLSLLPFFPSLSLGLQSICNCQGLPKETQSQSERLPRRRRGRQGFLIHQLRSADPPPPTTQGGVQNGSSVGTGYTLHERSCTFGRRLWVLSPCLVTKFLRRSSVGGLLRVLCLVGFPFPPPKKYTSGEGRRRKKGWEKPPFSLSLFYWKSYFPPSLLLGDEWYQKVWPG